MGGYGVEVEVEVEGRSSYSFSNGIGSLGIETPAVQLSGLIFLLSDRQRAPI